MSCGRPVTSKPRGVCKYYSTPRGCFAGANCKFLHGQGESLTPYDKNKICRYYTAGYCKRGAKCWFRHVQPTLNEASGSTSQDPVTVEEPKNEDGDDDLMCSICYERPVTFGLLDGCSHVFCVECIKGWRDPTDKGDDLIYSGNTKKCPSCRAPSKFVTPSSMFYTSNDPGKEKVIAQYKASMARVPCKYFQRSCPRYRFCPFGRDCFYQHLNEDGTPHRFSRGVDYYMRRKRDFERGQRFVFEDDFPFLEDVHAAIDTIRATLQNQSGDLIPQDDDGWGDLAAEDDVDLSVPTSLLTRLAEHMALSLMLGGRDIDLESIYSHRPMSVPLVDLVLNRNGMRDATSDPPRFSPPPDDEPEGDVILDPVPVPERDSDHESAQPVNNNIVEDASQDTHVQETVERIEETEPPFLTDGRGRVVWSNTKQGSTNGASA